MAGWYVVKASGAILTSDGSAATQLNDLSDVDSAAQTANYVLATPDGSPGNYSGRALVADDIPNLPASKITSGQLILEQGGTESDLSATGPGALVQASSGAAVTVETLDETRGGTGQTTITKGDLLAGSAANTLSKLAIGTDTYVLTADSAEGTGMKWAAAGTGDVTGPGSSTDNGIARWDGAGGDTLQDSGVTITDNNVLTLPDSATYAPLNITERSAEPSSPAANDVYMDDGTNTASTNPGWRRYTGAAWEDVGASAGSGGSGGLGNYNQVSYDPASNYTTTSSSYADVDATNITFDIVVQDADSLLLLGAYCAIQGAGTPGGLQIAVDGSAAVTHNMLIQDTTEHCCITGYYAPGSADTYTITLQYKSNGSANYIVRGDSDVVVWAVEIIPS